jgi:putative tryptophan/tyrosine transport system substrate-binding protein
MVRHHPPQVLDQEPLFPIVLWEGQGESKQMNKKICYFALGALFFALCFPVEAQQASKVPKIGFLVVPSRSFFADRMESFRQGLQSLGYVEGKNLLIEYRYAEGKLDRLPELAKELVGVKVDLIVTTTTPSVLAAKNATQTIPIVFAGVQDPVASGIVNGLARPGGNATGLSILGPDLSGKRLELLKEVVPKIAHVAFLSGVGPAAAVTVKETQAAAQALGLQFQSLEVRDSKDFDRAFEAIKKNRVQALLTIPGPIINSHQPRIIQFAAKNRLPTMYAAPEFVDGGGLMSYAPNYNDLFRRAALYVDKILKGSKPADLPVEQPMKFEFVINLKAAKQIGLTIPPNVLARADRVIR